MKTILFLLVILSMTTNLTSCARGYIAGKEPLQCSYEGTLTICDTNRTYNTVTSVEPLRPSYLPTFNAPIDDKY